jgi:hypothetical protein
VLRWTCTILAFVGLTFYFLVGVVSLEAWGAPAIIAWLAGGFVATFLLVGGALLGSWLTHRGERYLALSAAEAMATDSRPLVLYLRAFTDEPATRRSRSRVGHASTYVDYGSSEEAFLREELTRIGPFVAIGRPGDPLPQLGASRTYVEDADWRTVVIGLMEQAAALVIRIGRGEGLAWEIGQALSRFPPERLLFVVPRDVAAYSEFKYRADPHLPRPLPPFPPPPALNWLDRQRHVEYQLLGFLVFSPDGDGHLVQLEFKYEAPSKKTLKREYARCLAPFIDRLLTAAPRTKASPGIAHYPRWRFRAPPTWPQPPPGWAPPPGWRPDPSWPPPPTAWTFWTREPP